jgi:hypothetical protein
MDLVTRIELPCTAARAREELRTLDHYPEWLTIVRCALPDGDAVWRVDLGARVGLIPFTKRLRMRRTVDEADHVRFERHDGPHHSPWILDVTWEAEAQRPEAVFSTLSLHYGGNRWFPGLDLILQREVGRAGPRLRARVQ